MSPAYDVCLALVIFFITPLQALRIGASKECESFACDVQDGHLHLRQSCDNQFVKHTPKSFQGFLDFGWQGLMAFPEQNFAFCTIPKNACRSWLRVLEKVYLNDPGYTPSDTFIRLKEHVQSASARADVFSNPSATRAVFVRDPIARLASVFFDKCASHKGPCPIDHNVWVSIRKIVSWALNADLGPSHLNEHWVMQSHFCELKERIHEYTFIGYMTKESLTRDAACLLEEAGLAKFNAEFVGDETPTEKNTWTNEERLLMKLFTKDAAKELVQKFADDYSTFGLPEPAWVESATGEWYDKIPSNSSAQHRDNQAVDEDEDDIVKLASRFGYF
mmetsp:Transcript_64130/g.173140  ORF Transcript_64130/g.173140 Transcript_64130/m.173140 type:complete len:333 (-) Transcript_64130:254-1252(-)